MGVTAGEIYYTTSIWEAHNLKKEEIEQPSGGRQSA